MAIKTFSSGEVLTAADTNTYLNNGGLVYVGASSFTNQASHTFNNIFTLTYDHYRVIFQMTPNPNTSAYAAFRMVDAGGTIQTTNYTAKSIWMNISNSTIGFNDYDLSFVNAPIGPLSSTIPGAVSLDIYNPRVSTLQTSWNGISTAQQTGVANYTAFIGGQHQVAAAYTGLNVITRTGQNISGSITVYGYRKA